MTSLHQNLTRIGMNENLAEWIRICLHDPDDFDAHRFWWNVSYVQARREAQEWLDGHVGTWPDGSQVLRVAPMEYVQANAKLSAYADALEQARRQQCCGDAACYNEDSGVECVAHRVRGAPQEPMPEEIWWYPEAASEATPNRHR